MLSRFANWARGQGSPLARAVFRLAKAVRNFNVPVVPGLHRCLLAVHLGVSGGLRWTVEKLYWTPLLKAA